MGRFGISFSDERAGFKIDRRKHYATISNDEDNSDSLFQRTLAWISYFVLVFVALCMFNTPALAKVIGNTKDMFLAPTINSLGDRPAIAFDQSRYQGWTLRGTR